MKGEIGPHGRREGHMGGEIGPYERRDRAMKGEMEGERVVWVER